MCNWAPTEFRSELDEEAHTDEDLVSKNNLRMTHNALLEKDTSNKLLEPKNLKRRTFAQWSQ
jgi:hypothetical protein